MRPLPSESAGMRATSPTSNCCQNGSKPKGFMRWLTILVAEMLTTASLVFRTTSTVTVRRRLICSGGSVAAIRKSARQQIISLITTSMRTAVVLDITEIDTQVGGKHVVPYFHRLYPSPIMRAHVGVTRALH